MRNFEDIKKEILTTVNIDSLTKARELCEEMDVVSEFYADKFVMNELLKELITSHRDGGISASAVVKFGVENRRYCENALNVEFCSNLLQSKLFDIEQFIRAFREAGEFANLLKSAKFFQYVIDNNYLNKEEISTVCNTLNSPFEWRELCNNEVLLEYVLKNKLLSFDDFLRTTKISGNLVNLLSNQTFFKNALTNKTLSKKQIEAILDKISEDSEFNVLLHSEYCKKDDQFLLRWAVDNNALTKEHAKKILNSASSSILRLNTLSQNKETLDKFLAIVELEFSDFVKLQLRSLKNTEDVIRFFSMFESSSLDYVLEHSLYTDDSVKNLFSAVNDELFEDRRDIFHQSRLCNNQTLKYMLVLSEKTTRDYRWLNRLTESSKKSEVLLRDLDETERSFSKYLREANRMYHEERGQDADSDRGRQFSEEVMSTIEVQELLGNFDFSFEEKQELFNKIQESSRKEKALNYLRDIISTNTESTYKDVDSLAAIILKDEQKKKKKLNF